MNEHVRYEFDMFVRCHQLLHEHTSVVLKNALHEAFYVHMKNLLWYYGDWSLATAKEAEAYVTKIQDQILTIGPMRTGVTDANRLRTPDARAYALVMEIVPQNLTAALSV